MTRRKWECKWGHDLTIHGYQGKDRARGCTSCRREAAAKQQHLVRSAASALGITYSTYVKVYGQGREAALHILKMKGAA